MLRIAQAGSRGSTQAVAHAAAHALSARCTIRSHREAGQPDANTAPKRRGGNAEVKFANVSDFTNTAPASRRELRANAQRSMYMLPPDTVVAPEGGPALVVAGLDLRLAPLSRPLAQPAGAKAGRDPSIEAAASVETMCELQLLSGTLVLLLNQDGGAGCARPAHLYALEPPADGPAPEHRTLYCSPLLLHNLQLHAACESAPLALDATQANGSLGRPTATVLVRKILFVSELLLCSVTYWYGRMRSLVWSMEVRLDLSTSCPRSSIVVHKYACCITIGSSPSVPSSIRV